MFVSTPSDFTFFQPVSIQLHKALPWSFSSAATSFPFQIYLLTIHLSAWMQSELFPLNVRSLGSSISTSTNWGANFIVGLTFLPMMEFLTPFWTFIIYAGVCIVGWLFIWRIYPETKGLSLEEV